MVDYTRRRTRNRDRLSRDRPAATTRNIPGPTASGCREVAAIPRGIGVPGTVAGLALALETYGSGQSR